MHDNTDLARLNTPLPAFYPIGGEFGPFFDSEIGELLLEDENVEE